MKQYGLSLIWSNNSGFLDWLNSGPRAVGYAEASGTQSIPSVTFGGVAVNIPAEAVVSSALSLEALVSDASVNAEAVPTSNFSNRFWLASAPEYGEAVDLNTSGLWCAQQFCQTGAGIENVDPLVVAPSNSGTLDTVSPLSHASAKWFVTVTDNVTSETKVSEITAAFTSGMPSFTQHAITGDRINTNINVIYVSGNVSVIATNNGANTVTVRAARILTEV